MIGEIILYSLGIVALLYWIVGIIYEFVNRDKYDKYDNWL